MKDLIISIILIIIAQVMAYFQLQSQFIWTWAKQNPLLISLIGWPISIVLIYFTKYCASAFGGQIWPGRLIGFAVGAIVFAFLSHYVMNEPMNGKTTASLILAAGILLIQIFWKN
jgi:hypothetical protein